MRKNSLEAGIDRRTFLRKSALAATVSLFGFTLAGDDPKPFQPEVWPKPKLNPHADNILMITDAHIALGSPEWFALIEVIANLKDQAFALVMQLGDLIDETNDEVENIDTYERGLELFQQFLATVIHLPGNHCLWGIIKETLENMYVHRGLNPMYGVQKFDGYQVVWPDLLSPRDSHGTFPPAMIEWLPEIIGTTPTILCYHYPLGEIDASNHYHFNSHPDKIVVTNYPELKELVAELNHRPIIAIVHGHVHQAGVTWLGKIPQISLPSLRQEPYALSQYTVLEVTDDHALFKNFHRGNSTGSVRIPR